MVIPVAVNVRPVALRYGAMAAVLTRSPPSQVSMPETITLSSPLSWPEETSRLAALTVLPLESINVPPERTALPRLALLPLLKVTVPSLKVLVLPIE